MVTVVLAKFLTWAASLAIDASIPKRWVEKILMFYFCCKNKKNILKKLQQYSNCLAAGMLLTISFTHILPEA